MARVLILVVSGRDELGPLGRLANDSLFDVLHSCGDTVEQVPRVRTDAVFELIETVTHAGLIVVGLPLSAEQLGALGLLLIVEMSKVRGRIIHLFTMRR